MSKGPEQCDQVCDECGYIFTVAEVDGENPLHWGHPCKSRPDGARGAPQACASHRSPIVPVVAQEDALSSPMASALLLTLKAECEAQHARAEAAEAELKHFKTQYTLSGGLPKMISLENDVAALKVQLGKVQQIVQEMEQRDPMVGTFADRYGSEDGEYWSAEPIQNYIKQLRAVVPKE